MVAAVAEARVRVYCRGHDGTGVPSTKGREMPQEAGREGFLLVNILAD